MMSDLILLLATEPAEHLERIAQQMECRICYQYRAASSYGTKSLI